MAERPSALIGNREAEEFIRQHESEDPFNLSLQFREAAGLPVSLLARQITSRQKAKHKLPEWYARPQVIFPDPVNLQQASSEATAIYKSTIIAPGPVADLTGGTGIDLYYMSRNFDAIYVEPDADLCRLAAHNYSILEKSIRIHNETAESFLPEIPEDIQVYLDPSRRDSANKKTVAFADCQPDVIHILPLILQRTDKILIKASPLIDLTQACRELSMHVSEIHVVEWEGECREVLFKIDRDIHESPKITAIDLSSAITLEFTAKDEAALSVHYGPVSGWLYEPSPAVLKSGAFNTVASRFGLVKLHQNTHLYTSDTLVPGFPGRVFLVLENMTYHAGTLKKACKENKANITTRNFPKTVADIRKKTGIRDGGELYVFAFTGFDGKLMMCITVRPEEGA